LSFTDVSDTFRLEPRGQVVIKNSESIRVAPDAAATLDAVAVGWRQKLGTSVKSTIRIGASVMLYAALVCAVQPARAQFVQQRAKLIGTGAIGTAQQGSSVALSADGNTAIVGGDQDNSQAGAAWVFTRTGGAWAQQGGKLIGTGAIGVAQQGIAVALSADGNTAIVGGNEDNTEVGAAWVYTRSSGLWHQQAKLIATGGVNAPQLGGAVALSADGNTAIVGGYQDSSGAGAVWIFTRAAGLWSQQGAKLVGSNAVGAFSHQGVSVAVSADGNTLIEGGYQDDSSVGAAWVFTRSGGTWTQQGSKLVGTGAAGTASQGTAVSLSADGNTAIVSGFTDNSGAGATWVFTRSSGVWTQHGNPLFGFGAIGAASQGISVSLSSDGNTAVVGGYQDNSGIGAAWVYTYAFGFLRQYGPKLVGAGAAGGSSQGSSAALSGDGRTVIVGGPNDNSHAGAAWVFTSQVTHDVNADGKSDIFFRNTSSGAVVGWLMNGSAITQSATVATVPSAWQIVAQRDFDGDGKTDLLWRNTSTGAVALWLMNGLTVTQTFNIGTVPTHWVLAGASDFDGDGKADILWRDSTTGAVAMWLMNGGTITQTGTVATVANAWVIAGTDAHGHIVWRNSSSGAVTIWDMNGFSVSQTHNIGSVAPAWAIVGIGDFDGDAQTDLLWRHTSSGAVAIWFVADGTVQGSTSLGTVPTSWSVSLTGDFNGNRVSDIVWTNTNGARSIWFMNDAAVANTASLGTVPTAWAIQSAGAE
jgi:hypothetical protein